MIIHLATDHAGLDLIDKIKIYLSGMDHEVIDHGAYEYDALDDYPDFIFPCALAVSEDKNSKGIILGGSGQGEAMAANRVKGVRAAVVVTEWNEFRALTPTQFAAEMTGNVLVDLRNVYEPSVMQEAGFHYVSIGR